MRIMELIGENIKLARRRRKFTSTDIANRAGVSRFTLNKIEKGDPTVSIGAYYAVLKNLGLGDDLLKVASDDHLRFKLASFSKDNLKYPFIAKRRVLARLGMNLRLARKRRNLSMIQVGDGANISRPTLRRVEKGDGTVSIATYFKVLRVLNLHNDFLKIASEDKVGLELRDLELLK